RNLSEALATARMLERRGYNFSLGLAQVNRKNLAKYGLDSYEKAFQACPNLQAGSRILAECYSRSQGSWPKSFSCYYSGDFKTGFRHGYVQKIYASIRATDPAPAVDPEAIELAGRNASKVVASAAPTRAQPLDATRISSTWPATARPDDPASDAVYSPVSGPVVTPTHPRAPVRVSLAGQVESALMTGRQADRTAVSPPPTGATTTAS